MNKGDTIIDLRHIVKRFFIGKSNELEILHGIDLQVKEGEFLSVIGESGSGKVYAYEYYRRIRPPDRRNI